MRAWRGNTQLSLRLADVVIEMQSGEAEYLAMQRYTHEAAEYFSGSCEVSKGPAGNVQTWARHANDIRYCDKKLFEGDVFPAEDITLAYCPML